MKYSNVWSHFWSNNSHDIVGLYRKEQLLKIKLPKNSKLKRISHLKPTLVKWTIGQMIALVKITENKFSENLVYGEQILLSSARYLEAIEPPNLLLSFAWYVFRSKWTPISKFLPFA